MSALETIALSIVATWLAIITIVVAALARQIALLASRFSFAGSVGDTGLGVGTLIPKELRDTVPQLWHGLNYILFTSPTCGPCIELVKHLDEFSVNGTRLIAPVVADDDMARDFVATFPSTVSLVRDPIATRLFELLAINATPFVLEIEGGVVTGKAYLRGIRDLNNLIAARDTSDAADIFEGRKGVALS